MIGQSFRPERIRNLAGCGNRRNPSCRGMDDARPVCRGSYCHVSGCGTGLRGLPSQLRGRFPCLQPSDRGIAERQACVSRGQAASRQVRRRSGLPFGPGAICPGMQGLRYCPGTGALRQQVHHSGVSEDCVDGIMPGASTPGSPAQDIEALDGGVLPKMVTDAPDTGWNAVRTDGFAHFRQSGPAGQSATRLRGEGAVAGLNAVAVQRNRSAENGPRLSDMSSPAASCATSFPVMPASVSPRCWCPKA